MDRRCATTISRSGFDGVIPDSEVGRLLGVADRLDTVAGLFAVGETPIGFEGPLRSAPGRPGRGQDRDRQRAGIWISRRRSRPRSSWWKSSRRTTPDDLEQRGHGFRGRPGPPLAHRCGGCVRRHRGRGHGGGVVRSAERAWPAPRRCSAFVKPTVSEASRWPSSGCATSPKTSPTRTVDPALFEQPRSVSSTKPPRSFRAALQDLLPDRRVGRGLSDAWSRWPTCSSVSLSRCW